MQVSFEWLLTGLSLIAMLFVCFGLWLLRGVPGKPPVPAHWPLHARVLVNEDELRAWHWLAETFDDHHVMIKIPVTRFTRPNARENDRSLYELLKNINCTFSVCAEDGHVIGCVDVPKPFGLSRRDRILKENLLAECGISYIVLDLDRLPSAVEIRNEFLGEMASSVRTLKREQAVVKTARINLKKTLAQQRRMRKLPIVNKGKGRDHPNSSVPSRWHDSFLFQTNSLPAELRNDNGRRC